MKRILCVLLLVLTLGCMTVSCGLTVPRPEIKEGEFHFTVTYEYNGETKTVSGVYVCAYNGVDWSLDGGAHREWVGYIKGDELEEVIELGTTASGDKIELNFAFYPEYFMGDPVTGGREAPLPWISVRVESDEGLYFENDAALIAEAYGAKIIRYEYDEPIENTFG